MPFRVYSEARSSLLHASGALNGLSTWYESHPLPRDRFWIPRTVDVRSEIMSSDGFLTDIEGHKPVLYSVYQDAMIRW